MQYLILKTIHIIVMMGWLGGLTVIIYLLNRQSRFLRQNGDNNHLLNQHYASIESDIFRYVCHPTLFLTWGLGIAMIAMLGLEWLKSNGWMHLKLLFVLFLTIYHVYCGTIILRFKHTAPKIIHGMHIHYSIIVVFYIVIFGSAIVKNAASAVWVVISALLTGIVIYLIMQFRLRKTQK